MLQQLHRIVLIALVHIRCKVRGVGSVAEAFGALSEALEPKDQTKWIPRYRHSVCEQLSAETSDLAQSLKSEVRRKVFSKKANKSM